MRRGFSLIEVMVVLGIVVVLFGIAFSSLRDQKSDSEVQAEAERLAAVLRQTRNRAMAERAAYGVVFNLRNAVGTSGAVLNNWDGGHWYRVIGPGRGNDYHPHALPLAGPAHGGGPNRNFPNFLENVAASWVSEPYVLPKREVRFLALGDTDEGRRHVQGWAGASEHVYYGEGGATTWPRPWFGVWDQGSRRLHAWGGYDPARDWSGFHYEGADGDITGSVNPSDRRYDNDFDRDGTFADVDRNNDGDLDDAGERERDYPIWLQGEGRPLVDARFMDACIMFGPDGEARFLEWNRGRRAYTDQQAAAAPVAGGPDLTAGRNGIADRAKCRRSGESYTNYWWVRWMYTGPEHRYEDDVQEVGHFVRHTGGWHLTLAPDAVQDDNRFPTVDKALDSITPAWRVFVGESGAVRVFRVQRRGPGFLDEGPVWPADPATWNESAHASSNPLWRRCRLGWLHEDEGADDAGLLVPVGEPIVDRITERMLAERIWWFDQ